MQPSFLVDVLPIILSTLGILALFLILGYMIYGEEEEE